MKHLFVPYAIALILKEKGFNQGCFAAFQLTFEENEEPFEIVEIVPLKWYDNNNHRLPSRFICTAPLYQQVIDWLWDNHQILIYPYRVPDKTNTIMWCTQSEIIDFWSTKDQAIEEALKLIK